MENEIKEMSLQETLVKLKEQRSNFYQESARVREKMLVKINELIEKTETLQHSTDLEDRILIGSLADLRVCYGEDDVEYVSYYLGFDFTENSISLFSPLGSAIYGVKVNETIPYDVNGDHMKVTILNKNVIEEKSPEEITLTDSVIEGPVKKKI